MRPHTPTKWPPIIHQAMALFLSSVNAHAHSTPPQPPTDKKAIPKIAELAPRQYCSSKLTQLWLCLAKHVFERKFTLIRHPRITNSFDQTNNTHFARLDTGGLHE